MNTKKSRAALKQTMSIAQLKKRIDELVEDKLRLIQQYTEVERDRREVRQLYDKLVSTNSSKLEGERDWLRQFIMHTYSKPLRTVRTHADGSVIESDHYTEADKQSPSGQFRMFQ